MSGLNVLISGKQATFGGEEPNTVTQADRLKSQEEIIH